MLFKECLSVLDDTTHVFFKVHLKHHQHHSRITNFYMEWKMSLLDSRVEFLCVTVTSVKSLTGVVVEDFLAFSLAFNFMESQFNSFFPKQF